MIALLKPFFFNICMCMTYIPLWLFKVFYGPYKNNFIITFCNNKKIKKWYHAKTCLVLLVAFIFLAIKLVPKLSTLKNIGMTIFVFNDCITWTKILISLAASLKALHSTLLLESAAVHWILVFHRIATFSKYMIYPLTLLCVYLSLAQSLPE